VIRWFSFCSRLIVRALTARFRVLPNVFVLGATKAGSTSLQHILWQHPAHVEAWAKELMYLQCLPHFHTNFGHNQIISFLWGRYRNGHSTYTINGYRKFFPTRLEMKRRQRATRVSITSDCDPFNLYCPIAMRRIAELSTQPKFIISLRNPIDRAFSDYNMHRANNDQMPSFETAIELEVNGEEKAFRRRYLNQSIYAPHIQRWFSEFPRESFLIVKAEDLFSDAATVSSTMFDFLGLPRAAVDVSSQNVGRRGDRMLPATRSLLSNYFAAPNARLYELLGRDMKWD
jgi:hypothetical protein